MGKISQKQKKPGKVGIILVTLLLLVVLAVNIATNKYANVITQYLAKPTVSSKEDLEEARKSGEDVAVEIVNEGVVLIQNENDALPLDISNEKEKNVNVFGWASINPEYSGVGSASGNIANPVTLIKGLENAGFSPNQELVSFYEGMGWKRGDTDSNGRFKSDYTRHEVPVAQYSEELISHVKDYSDTALIVLTRVGGESQDSPLNMSEYGGRADEHYLQLGDHEKEMIDMVTSMGFGKVVLLLNSSRPMELGFLENTNIDSVLWIGGPGQVGMTGVGNALSGKINPSGRLVNTYPFDLLSAPSNANFGNFDYTDSMHTRTYIEYGMSFEQNFKYLNYSEGIYIGYRYYETRYIDNESGKSDETAYRAAVQYPFGYGLSYTTFNQEITSYEAKDNQINMSVKVTNTGSAEGKDVVQLYYTPPYMVEGIEKSHIVLADYGKTGVLKPGESQMIDFKVNVQDWASFDEKINNSYVLDAGTYQVKLMNNAHDVIDFREYKVDSTVVYDESNKRDTDLIPAVSRFAEAEGDIVYLSRADWEGTFPKDVPREQPISPELLAELMNLNPPEDLGAEDIIFAKNGLTLTEMIGLDYNDPKWTKLLEQLSVEEMQNLIGFGGFGSQAVESVGKPAAIDLDGPGGIKSLMTTDYNTVGYPTAVVIGSTWNSELIEKLGESFGKEADIWGISGVYGPAINLHRNHFGGRNYEFYSEDPLVSGKSAAAFTKGIATQNIYCYVKHFVAFGQYENAHGLAVWLNEQSLRELYMKPFEYSVKAGNTQAIMSSYTRLGSKWTGGNNALLTDVLRGEWGFQGMVVTDYVAFDYENANQGIHAGNDLMLSTVGNIPTDTSNAGKQAMRQASHNILYTVANSRAMGDEFFGYIPYWKYVLIGVDVIVALGAGLFFLKRFKKSKVLNK